MARRWITGSAICIVLVLGVAASAQYRDTSPNQGPPPNQGTYQTPNLIAEGTRFVVRLDDSLDSSKIKPGKKFNAKLSEDLVAPNGATIPAGKKIHAHVSSVERGMHGRVLLSFDEIETRHGWRPLAATITDVPGEHGVKQISNEGEIEKKGPTKRRVAEGAVVGAAVGAAAGGAAAGAHGAVIGAVAGGALGGGAGLLLDRDFKLNKGQQLELRLDRPLQVPQ